MTVWDNIYTCPVCGTDKCVPPSGDKNSPVLIVGEFPGGEEIIDGVPFSGRTGTILKQQLQRLKWNLSNFRVMNMWQHEPNDNKECLNSGIEMVLQEILGEPKHDINTGEIYYPDMKRAVLLVGSDVAKVFLDHNVSDVCGIPVESKYFSADLVVAMVNPAIVFHGVLGEIQLALKKFTDKIGEFYG